MINNNTKTMKKKIIYYAAIFASFASIWLLGAFICAVMGVRGGSLMIFFGLLGISAARLTAKLLKSRLNPTPETSESDKEID